MPWRRIFRLYRTYFATFLTLCGALGAFGLESIATIVNLPTATIGIIGWAFIGVGCWALYRFIWGEFNPIMIRDVSVTVIPPENKGAQK